MFDQSLVLYSPLFPDGVKGIEGRGKIEQNFLKSMPDFEFKILDIASNGGFVAAELIGAGASTGPVEILDRPPIPPTGSSCGIQTWLFRVNSKGLIEEERYYHDSAVVLKQLRG
jgi:predicted ester cyclase